MMLAGFLCSRADDRGRAKEHLNSLSPRKRHKSISDFISRGIPDPRSLSPRPRIIVEWWRFGEPGTNWLAARSQQEGRGYEDFPCTTTMHAAKQNIESFCLMMFLPVWAANSENSSAMDACVYR